MLGRDGEGERVRRGTSGRRGELGPSFLGSRYHHPNDDHTEPIQYTDRLRPQSRLVS